MDKQSREFLRRSGRAACTNLVIGSGAGGALTAAYLAEQGQDVLVLEEGPCRGPAGSGLGITDTLPVLWREGGFIPVLGNARFVFAEGRCLGGGTAVNSAMIHRIPEAIAAEWEGLFRISAFKYDALEAYHQRIERDLRVGTPRQDGSRAYRLFRKGAEHCGFRGMDVPLAATVVDGKLKRNTMLETYLKRAQERGARIVTGCRVSRILVRNRRAFGVIACLSGTGEDAMSVRIDCGNIFLCAGAVQTPLLLRRSGISRNIGSSIRFHPTLRVLAEFRDVVNAYAHPVASYQVKEFSPDISLGASVSMPPFLAAFSAAAWPERKELFGKTDRSAIYYAMIRGNGRGIVRNLPVRGSYFLRYTLGRGDLENLRRGFALLCRVLFAAGARRIFPSVDGLGPLSGGEAVDGAASRIGLKNLNLMSVHSFSSCPMGEEAAVCAVDSFGRVHGFENMYVNDASMLPSAPGVNPQGPLMAIALRNIETNFHERMAGQ